MMAASFDDYVFCHAVYLLILAKKRRTKDFFFNARDSGVGGGVGHVTCQVVLGVRERHGNPPAFNIGWGAA